MPAEPTPTGCGSIRLERSRQLPAQRRELGTARFPAGLLANN